MLQEVRKGGVQEQDLPWTGPTGENKRWLIIRSADSLSRDREQCGFLRDDVESMQADLCAASVLKAAVGHQRVSLN